MRVRSEKDTFHRQMGAIIAKLLNDIEDLDTIRVLHPFDLDRLRKRCISAAWDCYVVGLNKGTSEKVNDEPIYNSKHRAVGS